MNNNVELDNKAIGQKIREERKKLGLSRSEFAEIIELSDYYVGQLERGERQMSLPVLVKVTNCLHVTLDYLVFGKITYYDYNIREIRNTYDTFEKNDYYSEVNNLLTKCSPKELDLVKKLIVTILPYLNTN